ncbi:MAG: polymer-forming cytoskeletal protein, partial [Clostridia bacterium]|nr:polymer-forming cytoskeletal protein [Clostridia bacterium]
MFSKKNAPLAMDTVLGEYTTFVGNIESEGSIKILGKVEGDVKAGGDVYIESPSTINGNIYGSNVYVSGTIKGNILSKGILHLMAQARLYGDIEVSS